MSNAHFGLLPGMALQLAAQVDAYAAAIRLRAREPRNIAQLSAAARLLDVIKEHAKPLPSLWTEWGRFVVAHAEFSLVSLRDPGAPELPWRLMELEVATEALMARAVQWALLEQEQFPVSIDIAQAFIEWEAARKVCFDLRRAAASRRRSQANAGAEPIDAQAQSELQGSWDLKCASLLAEAIRLLESSSRRTA